MRSAWKSLRDITTEQHSGRSTRGFAGRLQTSYREPAGDYGINMSEHTHATHPEIVKRLKRAEGHLRSVIAMFEGDRSCLDIAQQLHAVEKAITQAKRTLIQDHLDHCLEETVGALPKDQRQTIDEFKVITKYL